MAFALAAVSGCRDKQEITGITMPSISRAAIVKISCDSTVGTGIMVGPRQAFTANHVMGTGCQIAADRVISSRTHQNNRVTLASQEVDHDFATAHTSSMVTRRTMKWSCDGLVAGETYWMAGYPGGGALAVNEGVALGHYVNGYEASKNLSTLHLRAVNGTVEHGMSGGPVINREGKVVAVISAYSGTNRSIALVKEIRDTQLCATPPA